MAQPPNPAQEAAERIFTLLAQCLSPDTETRVTAENCIRAARDEPNFFGSLTMILNAADEDVQTNVKLLAALCAKNAVNRCWRRPRSSKISTPGISEEEREYVYGGVMHAIGNVEARIDVQVSDWIAKIARLDFPDHWPRLLDQLNARLSANDAKTVVHALVTIDMVLKQISSRRLLSAKKSFYAVAPGQISILAQFMDVHVASVVSYADVDGAETTVSFKIVEYCLKSLRRLVVHGLAHIDGVPDVEKLLARLSAVPGLFFAGVDAVGPVRKRFTKLSAKLVVHVHRQHPLGFRRYLAQFLDLYIGQITAYDSQSSSEHTGFQIMRFLRNSVQCMQYKLLPSVVEAHKKGVFIPSTPEEEGADIILKCFSVARSKTFVESLLRKVVVYSSRELEMWFTDPEALVLEEESAELGEWSMRHEALDILKTLIVREKAEMIGYIMSTLQGLGEHELLVRDACYRVLGNSVYDIGAELPFEAWLRDSLGPVLVSERSHVVEHCVLKARAVWICGQYVSYIPRRVRKELYPLLLPLMSIRSQDRIVALTAAKSIQFFVEDVEFCGEDFVPFLQRSLSDAFEMSTQCENIDTKRDVLGLAASLVSNCPVEAVSALRDHIVDMVPLLWAQAGEVPTTVSVSAHDTETRWNRETGDGSDNLYRVAVVLFITAALQKLGPDMVGNPGLHALLCEILQYGTNLSSSGSPGVYMLAETCELWHVTLLSMTQLTPPVAALFSQVYVILGSDFENLPTMLRVISEYAALGGDDFLRAHGENLSALFTRALGQLKDRGVLSLCNTLAWMLQKFPAEGPRVFAEPLRYCLHGAGTGFYGSVVLTGFVSVVLRSMVMNVEGTETYVLQRDDGRAKQLLEVAVKHYSGMFGVRSLKFCAVGVLGMITRYGVRNGEIRDMLPSVLEKLVLPALIEERKRERQDASDISGVNDFSGATTGHGESFKGVVSAADKAVAARGGVPLPGSQRAQELQKRDPLRTMRIQSAMQEMSGTMIAAGQGMYDEAIARVDNEVVGQLRTLMSGN